MSYIGRFAPSPTGPVHFGTLVAAVASYLRARSLQGRWLLRIEDVDTLRKVDDADTRIIQTLERLGFEWDGDIVYQTSRNQAYEQALSALRQADLVFPCRCTRKQLMRETGVWSPVYPGTCYASKAWDEPDHSVRLRVSDETIAYEDVVYGAQQENVANSVGDFVIRRRDGLFAYQLAVVVDDAWQGVTEVVRGTDLMESTARQIYLQRCLGLPTPAYLHVPVAVDAQGNKLSKSDGSARIDDSDAIPMLNRALAFLGQSEIDADDLGSFWRQAITQWDTDRIPKRHEIAVAP